MSVITKPNCRHEYGGKVEKVYGVDCPVCFYKQKRQHPVEAFFLTISIAKEFRVLNSFK